MQIINNTNQKIEFKEVEIGASASIDLSQIDSNDIKKIGELYRNSISLDNLLIIREKTIISDSEIMQGYTYINQDMEKTNTSDNEIIQGYTYINQDMETTNISDSEIMEGYTYINQDMETSNEDVKISIKEWLESENTKKMELKQFNLSIRDILSSNGFTDTDSIKHQAINSYITSNTSKSTKTSISEIFAILNKSKD